MKAGEEGGGGGGKKNAASGMLAALCLSLRCDRIDYRPSVGTSVTVVEGVGE